MTAKSKRSIVSFQLKDGGVQKFLLKQLRYRIGSDPTSDFMFEGLLPEHAEIVFDNGKWVVKRIHPDAMVEFNALPIELKKLNPGDVILFSEIAMQYSEISGTETAELRGVFTPRMMLRFRSGAILMKVPLFPGTYIIGRKVCGPERYICIDDPFISRRHAQIRVNWNGVTITDLNSRAGIKLNGNYTDFGVLNPGDILKIGNTIIHLEVMEELDNIRVISESQETWELKSENGS